MDILRKLHDLFPNALGTMPKIEPAAESNRPTAETQEQFKRRFDFKGATENIPKRLSEIPPEQRVSEDSVISDEELGLFAVADGVGGAGHGDVASRTAADALHEEIAALQKTTGKELDAKEIMRLGMERASEAIEEAKRADSNLEAMNTTLTALLMSERPDGRITGVFGHVGDSRAYHFKTTTGELLQVTKDDSLATALVRAGLIDWKEAKKLDQSVARGTDVSLTDSVLRERLQKKITALEEEIKEKQGAPMSVQEALVDKLNFLKKFQETTENVTNAVSTLFSRRNEITQALGAFDGRKSTPVIEEFEAEEGDLVFAVSDGISDVLTEEEILAIVKDGMEQNRPVAEILQNLSKAAVENISPRQKGKAGDDVGISGARIERRIWQGEAPEKLVQAKEWQEDPGILDDWRAELKSLRPEMKRWEIMRRAGRLLDEETQQKAMAAHQLVERLLEAVGDQLNQITAKGVWKKEEVAELTQELNELERLQADIIGSQRQAAERMAKS